MTEHKHHKKIGFIGFGKMAQALAKGFICKDLYCGDDIIGSKATIAGLEDGLLKTLQDQGVVVVQDNLQVARESQVLVLAVKPHILQGVLEQCRDDIGLETLIISVVTGITIETMCKLLRRPMTRPNIVRAMPNTPAQIGEGATIYTMSPGADEFATLVHRLFSSVGLCAEVTSSQFDVMLNGPGPAFAYLAIEALADGAVMMGLPRKLAIQMAAQTLKGAASLVLETGKHPGELKDDVCSPGGTTIRGVHVLEQSGFRAALMGAVKASTERSRELGQQ